MLESTVIKAAIFSLRSSLPECYGFRCQALNEDMEESSERTPIVMSARCLRKYRRGSDYHACHHDELHA